MGKMRIYYRTIILTYLSFVILVLTGHIRDQFGKIFTPWNYNHFYEINGIPPIYTTFESFFIRRLYQRICDCWNRPIAGVPGKIIDILERVSNDGNKTFKFTGNKIRSLNFGSYNYLGFAESAEITGNATIEALEAYDINYAYPTADYEPNDIVKTLEKEMAEFLYKEDCIVFSMGFGTNTWNIPMIMTDSLIFSDELNHTSLICGIRMSKSKVVIFKHNNMKDLEKKLIFHISQGQPETHRAWRKIFVVVEGIYSMEGTMVDLVKLVELKKKYKFYIYMDEAHSIGAMGRTGRGICEHLNVDFNDIDFLMGTYSKSFGGFGGYIAASKEVVSFLRQYSDASLYGEQMSPVIATQILGCLREIIRDQSRIKKLQENSRFMRTKLKKLGFQLLGHKDSPIVPVLIFNPGKIGEFSRTCLLKGLAVVVVGYPATPVISSRVRLCLSASHTIEDIEKTIQIIKKIGTILGMRI